MAHLQNRISTRSTQVLQKSHQANAQEKETLNDRYTDNKEKKGSTQQRVCDNSG